MRLNIIFLTLLINLPLYAADFSKRVLYEAYLASDMTVWGNYLKRMDTKSLSIAEMAEMVNYEYGYIAFCQGEKRMDEAEERLRLFEQHINRLETGGYSPSNVQVYRSSVCAYQIAYNKLKFISLANKAIAFVEKAVEIDSLNPIALTLKGNVDFYRPGAVGGSKKRALETFLKAEKLMRQQRMTVDCWNYRSLQMCIAQCYEKLGDKKKAIAYCEHILDEEPDFVYIRDVYLPELKK